MKELQSSFGSKCQYLDNLSLIDTTETISNLIANMMKKGNFDDLFNLYREYDLTPEMIKEHFEILLEYHSKSKSLG